MTIIQGEKKAVPDVDDAPFAAALLQVIEPPSLPDQPVLSAQVIIDRSGLANLIVVLRTRMGFPAETFALAARPLIEGFAELVQLQPVAGSSRHGRYGLGGGRLHRGLVIALRALDHRRGQILPRNAAPETLGALAHRWTYAVFAAALLHDVGSAESEGPVRVFERCVPPIIQTWLGEDPALMAELRAVLAGSADPSSAIVELVGRAVTGARPVVETNLPPCAQTASIASPIESHVESAPGVPAHDTREFLDSVDAEGSELPRRFMDWLRQGIARGALPVNARGALVHGVEEGILLASPGIFRAFIRRDGASQGESRDAARRVQREVLRCGWHLRAEGGVNIHGYAWKQDGRAAAPIRGIVILSPERFVDPVPAINPVLVRVVDVVQALD
jgi:hypothetical protein